MKNQFIKLVPILLACLFFSCEKDDDLQPNPNFTPMNLEALAVGQTFHFVLLEGESYYDEDNKAFTYTGDTLELSVVREEQGKFILSERITPGSKMMSSVDNYYWGDKNGVYENYWELRNDSLLITPVVNNSSGQSHLLFYNLRRFPLGDINTEAVQFDGWKTETTYSGDQVFFTTDFLLLGHNYDRLNVIVHNSPMAYDGNGATYVYSQTHGLVRTSTYSAWTGAGQGWDRIGE